ncbi:hypothetical protein BJX76DRAFT_328867 [Aspergillus varians]
MLDLSTYPLDRLSSATDIVKSLWTFKSRTYQETLREKYTAADLSGRIDPDSTTPRTCNSTNSMERSS